MEFCIISHRRDAMSAPNPAKSYVLLYSGHCLASGAPLNVTGNHPRGDGEKTEGRKEEIMETDRPTDRVVRPDAKRRHMEEEGDWSLEAGGTRGGAVQLS